MNVMTRLTACGLTLAMVLGLQACSHQTGETAPAASTSASTGSEAPATSLKITGYGPDGTKAGLAFNKQPDGSAAIWIRMNQPLDGDEAAIDFNGVLLHGNISGNLVTAGVSAELYAKPGVYKVHVIARKGELSMQSNDVAFTVE